MTQSTPELTRRGFLGLCLAAAVAPAIVRAASLMKILVPPAPRIATLAEQHAEDTEYAILYGDGIHDDTVALRAFIDGKPVRTALGITAMIDLNARRLSSGVFKVSKSLIYSGKSRGTIITDSRFEGTETADPIFYFDESFRNDTFPLQRSDIYMSQLPFNKKKIAS